MSNLVSDIIAAFYGQFAFPTKGDCTLGLALCDLGHVYAGVYDVPVREDSNKGAL